MEINLNNGRLIMHRTVRFLLIVISVLTLVAGCKQEKPKTEVNVTEDGIAIKGYDPVAYFTNHIPIQGSKEFSLQWKGATWLFANEMHKEMFDDNPEKYAPKYGGYCAYAVSQNRLADIDPQSWDIVDGTLYLNLNKDVQSIWRKDMPGYIEKADKNWPGVLKK